MKKNVVMAMVRLFKAFPKTEGGVNARNLGLLNSFNEKAIKHGLFVCPEANLVSWATRDDLLEIIKTYGISVEEMNATFHKSFSKVANASLEQLYFEQILHYMTTYGAEAFGFKAGELCPVYVPAEVLDLPEDVTDDTKIMVFGVMSEKEIKQAVKVLSEKNIAFSANTLDDIMLLAEAYDVDLDVDEISNKELRVRVCLEQNKVPANPQDFLRLLFFVVTNNSMVIKDRRSLSSIYSFFNDGYTDDRKKKVNTLFKVYVDKFGYVPLASIFYQHKKLWLVLKNSGNSSIINKIRRLADKYKKPAKFGVLDRITSDPAVDVVEVEKELAKVSLGKKVSLYNALAFRKANPESTTYRIRNGKMFFKEIGDKTPAIFDTDKADRIFEAIKKSVVEEVKEKVEGKVVYIPNTINYVFPTSEKDFIGGIPCGSIAHMGETATVGIHWENLPDGRVDLDFHGSTMDSDYGWNSRYRSADRGVLFTGDMTDAPVEQGGATECFYLGENVDQTFMFDVCFYNAWDKAFPFKYKLILDASPKEVFDREYILDKDTMLTCIQMELANANQKIGFVKTNEEGLKDFVFCNFKAGAGCVPNREPERKRMLIESLMLQYQTRLTLAEVLVKAGATVVDTRPEEGEFVDLSFEQITPTSIISLIY